MCFAVGQKLKIHIEPFLDVNCPKNKAHMLFGFLLDPRFLQMKSLLQLHKLEKVNSHEYFSNLTEKF